MVVEESCLLLELHIGVGNESVEIPLTSTHPFVFPSSTSSHSVSWLGASSQAPFLAISLQVWKWCLCFGAYMELVMD